jgi:hypothetical protein
MIGHNFYRLTLWNDSSMLAKSFGEIDPVSKNIPFIWFSIRVPVIGSGKKNKKFQKEVSVV